MNLSKNFVAVYVLICTLFISDGLGFLSCKTPTIKYGRIRSRQRGRAIKFLCNTSYQLVGERTAFCVDGQWDVATPKCVRATCPNKDSPPVNGFVLPTHNGAVLNFYCQQGYELNGPAVVFCDGFSWDNYRPSCVPSKTKPKLFCDFEVADLCHWTHDLNHDMDWVRDSYKTPTGYSMPTGPSFDHTLGNGSNGHYMYIESSSRRINDTARLISPVYGKMDNACLEFWYHMYGRTTGTLRAYLRRVTDPWPLKPSNAIFSKSGDQGNVWYREVIDLGPMETNFQIIMEGVRGNGYVSDIAIDDINIIPNCDYESLLQSTTESIPEATEILKIIESCEDRCGQKSFGNESSEVIACDCDDFCYETSRCCPDYVDVCLSRFSTSDSTNLPEEFTDITEVAAVDITLKNATQTVVFKSTAPTKTSIKTTTKSYVNISITTKRPTVIKLPPLIILQPPSTTEVVQRIFPPKQFHPIKNSSKIAFVKPKKETTPKTPDDDDTAVIPSIPFNDDELLLSSPQPSEEDSNDINGNNIQEKEDYVEKVANEKDYPFKIISSKPEPVGEIKTEFSHVRKDDSSVNLELITIATICGIILVAFLVGMGWSKLKLWRYRSRRITSGQGDSQSDVRFLTADEVLDFSLDRDYEDL